MKTKTQKDIIKIIDNHLGKEGLPFRKLVKDSYIISGFFSDTLVPKQYEHKIARSLKDCEDFSNDGFIATEDLGTFLLNALVN